MVYSCSRSSRPNSRVLSPISRVYRSTSLGSEATRCTILVAWVALAFMAIRDLSSFSLFSTIREWLQYSRRIDKQVWGNRGIVLARAVHGVEVNLQRQAAKHGCGGVEVSLRLSMNFQYIVLHGEREKVRDIQHQLAHVVMLLIYLQETMLLVSRTRTLALCVALLMLF